MQYKCKFKYFYTNRIVNVWNRLPSEIVNASNLNRFKNTIDSHFDMLIYEIDFNVYY